MNEDSNHSTALPRLSSPTLHAPDSRVLAGFYAALTGGSVTFASDDWSIVNGPNARIDIQRVDDYTPPTWPDGDHPLRMHLDFYVADLDAGVSHALACGASRAVHQPNVEHCVVMVDPVGHPFCLTTSEDIGAA